MKTNDLINSKTKTSISAACVMVVLLWAETASATAFTQINLVTDDPAVNPALLTDPSLKNAWGIAFGPNTPFWVSDNATGLSTLYNVNASQGTVTKVGLSASIPGDGSVTGQVFNGNANAFNGNRFLFVNEDGTISGWRSALGTTGTVPAETLQTGSTANIYKGVTEAQVNGNSYLYAANFGTGAINVIKGTSSAPDLTGNFTDPNLPSGYAPFNVQLLNNELFVTYAQQTPGSRDETDGIGFGFVDIFDTQGNLVERLAGQGTLDSPWGLAIAPSSFGAFAGDLLVGNFGDGTINAFNLATGHFDGQLKDANGNVIVIDGLWALTIGNDGAAGSSQTLYFSAGPNGEANGLFGALSPAAVPLPAAFWMFAPALLGIIRLNKRFA